jgi:hypothetical protein
VWIGSSSGIPRGGFFPERRHGRFLAGGHLEDSLAWQRQDLPGRSHVGDTHRVGAKAFADLLPLWHADALETQSDSRFPGVLVDATDSSIRQQRYSSAARFGRID